jgi:uncharacterized membrane protein
MKRIRLRAILKAISLVLFGIFLFFTNFLIWVYSTLSLEQKGVTLLMTALVIIYFVSLIWCYRHAYMIGAENGHKNENDNHVQGNA